MDGYDVTAARGYRFVRPTDEGRRAGEAVVNDEAADDTPKLMWLYMFKELDVVAVKMDLASMGLRRGNVGTIVQVYSADTSEVEFVDDAGKIYGLATLTSDQLLRLQFSSTATAA